jgi:hypothetical protein
MEKSKKNEREKNIENCHQREMQLSGNQYLPTHTDPQKMNLERKFLILIQAYNLGSQNILVTYLLNSIELWIAVHCNS